MDDDLGWDQPQKQFLILEPGTLASSFYLPPLVGVDPAMEYGKNHFIKALMSADLSDPQLIVLLWRIDMRRKSYSLNPNFVHAMPCKHESDEGVISTVFKLLYNIPPVFHHDFRLFALGKFSSMSAEAKQEIRVSSGVRYRVPGAGNTFIYDKKLLVLDRSPILRMYLEKVLDTKNESEIESFVKKHVSDIDERVAGELLAFRSTYLG